VQSLRTYIKEIRAPWDKVPKVQGVTSRQTRLDKAAHMERVHKEMHERQAQACQVRRANWKLTLQLQRQAAMATVAMQEPELAPLIQEAYHAECGDSAAEAKLKQLQKEKQDLETVQMAEAENIRAWELQQEEKLEDIDRQLAEAESIMAWERQAESSVDQSPQAQSSVAQTPSVSEISTPGQPKPEAQHQAQSPVSVPGTGSQGWSSSWWANGEWGNHQWQQPASLPVTMPPWQQPQWQQPASDNASTWGAGPGEAWVSTQACAPLGPAEPGPTGPWPTFAEVSGQDIQGSSQWL
jgi:hypothetical protein